MGILNTSSEATNNVTDGMNNEVQIVQSDHLAAEDHAIAIHNATAEAQAYGRATRCFQYVQKLSKEHSSSMKWAVAQLRHINIIHREYLNKKHSSS